MAPRAEAATSARVSCHRPSPPRTSRSNAPGSSGAAPPSPARGGGSTDAGLGVSRTAAGASEDGRRGPGSTHSNTARSQASMPPARTSSVRKSATMASRTEPPRASSSGSRFRMRHALSRAGSAPGESAKTGLAEPDSHHPPPRSFRASARSSFAPRRRLIMMVAHSGSVTGDLRLSRTARYVSRGSRHASTSAPAAASEREVPMWTTSSARSTCVSS